MQDPKVKILENFVNEIDKNRDKVWGVPVSHISKKNGYLASASYAELSRNLGLSQQGINFDLYKVSGYSPHLEKLNNILKEEGVILKGHIASALEVRRTTKYWWNNLTTDEKLNVKTFGNAIRFKAYIKNWRGGKGYEIVQDCGKELNAELLQLGGLDSDYFAVKDRGTLRDQEYRNKQHQAVQRWDDLAKKSLNSYREFVNVDSSDEPFVQLKQLAALVRKGAASVSSKNKPKEAFVHLCRFLEQNNIDPKSTLQDILSEFLLVRFHQDYVIPKMHNGNIAPSNAPTIISSVRKMLKRATKLKEISFHSFHDVEVKTLGRVTDTYKPYLKSERQAVTCAIQTSIDDTMALFEPYQKSGVGEYPLGDNGFIKPGFSNIENARYLFENHLNCIPTSFNGAQTLEEKGFLKIIEKLDMGLHEVYRSWGVPSVIDADTIAPFVYRLAQITGMNADPLFDIYVDDFVISHETTQKPCLRYWKERSSGGKQLHLDLFEAKLQWLSKKQSEEVKEVFENVIRITESIRKDAPEHVKDKLFMYKSTGQTTHGEIKSFSDLKGKTTSIYSNFVAKHDLKSESGEPLVFTISRFRPTFVSELLEAGVSIREIQLMLGHSNIETTMNYLDKLDFNRIAREKLTDAISKIHNRIFVKADDEASNKFLDNPDKVIFTTPLGGCSNIFSPPDFVKKVSGFKKGSPCSQYNKCLSCENVMITVDKLPMLFAMKRDYMLLMQRNRIMDTPHGYVIEENLCLLDEILNPKKSDFDAEVLFRAEKLAQFEETAVIDGVTV